MSGRVNKGKPGVIERISIFLNNHSWIKVVSAFVATIWFTIIIKFLGVTLKLSQEDGALTVGGWIWTSVVYGVMLAVSLLSLKESKLIKKTESSKKFLEHLLTSLDDLCDSNYDRVLAHVTDMGSQISSRDIYKKTVEPKNQLKDICREIKECMSELVTVGDNEIVVSMAYNIPHKGESWSWIDSKYVTEGLTLKTLLTNQNSTFWNVLNKSDNFIFYSDKDVAKADKCYIYDKKDREGKSKGSIICTRLPILIEDEIVAQIILSISTYGFKICDRKKENDVGEIIEKILLKRFFKRIRVELIHMYIKSK